jgi:triacylglycerol lipase
MQMRIVEDFHPNWLVIVPVLCVLLWARATDASEPDVDVVRNQVYVERESGALAADIYRPQGSGPFPGVLVVHGGAWTMGTRAQLAAVALALAKHGYTAAAISYPLAPKDPFPAQIYDCQAAVRWLRENAGEFKIDPARIGGFGYSAGGQLVALLGTLGDDDFREKGIPADAPSSRLQAVVAGGAPCDFRMLPANSPRLAYRLGGTRSDKPEAYRFASPAAFISSDDPPMFFFHGAKDALVPIRSPRRMVELLAISGVSAEFHTIQGAGHIGALFDRETLKMALAFADRNLKSEAGAGELGQAANGDVKVERGAADGQ